jgi:hypothetical protein
VRHQFITEHVSILKAAKIKSLRIYDADHSVLDAFSGSGLDLVTVLNNRLVKDVSYNADHALNWVRENVQAYVPCMASSSLLLN